LIAYAQRMNPRARRRDQLDEARELAARLAGDDAAASLADRIRRVLENGGGVIATDRLEARTALFEVQGMLSKREHSPRLLELRSSLVAFLER